VVLIMSATGVLLTYQRQIQAWADTRGLDGARPSASAAPLSPEAVVERAEAARPGKPTALRWRRDPDGPVEVVYGREGTLFVNGYTGAVLGDGSDRMRAFFRSVTEWHRWLALSGADRSRGRAITGAANLAFLFIVLAGFYLWWPRNLTARAFRNALLFRRGAKGKERDFNWHHVIGIWSLVPLVIIIASALVISYAWAGALVTRIAGDEAPVGVTALTDVAPPSVETSAGVADTTAGAAFLLERARTHMPDWRTVTMQLPARDGTVTFTLDRGNGGQPWKRAGLTLSAATGDLAGWEPFSSGSRPQQVRTILRFAHTGEVLGIAGQTVAGAASAGVIVMVWTGIALGLRRLMAWLRRRRRYGRSGRTPRNVAGGGTKRAA
jgi:uncharacterized iron-regulated membrane protein